MESFGEHDHDAWMLMIFSRSWSMSYGHASRIDEAFGVVQLIFSFLHQHGFGFGVSIFRAPEDDSVIRD